MPNPSQTSIVYWLDSLALWSDGPSSPPVAPSSLHFMAGSDLGVSSSFIHQSNPSCQHAKHSTSRVIQRFTSLLPIATSTAAFQRRSDAIARVIAAVLKMPPNGNVEEYQRPVRTASGKPQMDPHQRPRRVRRISKEQWRISWDAAGLMRNPPRCPRDAKAVTSGGVQPPKIESRISKNL